MVSVTHNKYNHQLGYSKHVNHIDDNIKGHYHHAASHDHIDDTLMLYIQTCSTEGTIDLTEVTAIETFNIFCCNFFVDSIDREK